MINSIQAGYRTQTIAPVQREREKAAAESTTRTQQGDTVSLSTPGKMISKLLTDMGGDPNSSSISLEEMESNLESKRAQLEDNITALFLQNGISTTPPVELTSDGEGKIRVKGDHPQKDKIEKLFEENPDLANDFRGVSAQTDFVEAGKEHVEFAKEYAKNPYAAVAKYNSLFSTLQTDEFSMIFDSEGQEDAA